MNSEEKKPKKKDNQLKKYAQLSGIGFQMGATIFLFSYIGKRIDAHYQMEKQWFTIVGVLLGVFVSLYSLLRSLKRINK